MDTGQQSPRRSQQPLYTALEPALSAQPDFLPGPGVQVPLWALTQQNLQNFTPFFSVAPGLPEGKGVGVASPVLAGAAATPADG